MEGTGRTSRDPKGGFLAYGKNGYPERRGPVRWSHVRRAVWDREWAYFWCWFVIWLVIIVAILLAVSAAFVNRDGKNHKKKGHHEDHVADQFVRGGSSLQLGQGSQDGGPSRYYYDESRPFRANSHYRYVREGEAWDPSGGGDTRRIEFPDDDRFSPRREEDEDVLFRRDPDRPIRINIGKSVTLSEEHGDGRGDSYFYLGRRFDWGKKKGVKGYAHMIYFDPNGTTSNRTPPPPPPHPSPRSRGKRASASGRAVVVEEASGPSCLDPFAEGARWKERETWIVDPRNDQGITEKMFCQAVWESMVEWDSKLNYMLFGEKSNMGVSTSFDLGSPNGKNTVQFLYIDDPGVLAVAVTWGIFDGPIPQREIVEVKVGFNLNFRWGDAAKDPSIIDIRGICTHELGHGLGFRHTEASGATMFASAGAGETHKRDLLPCEVVGLCVHYGEELICPGENSTGPTVPPFFRNGSDKLLHHHHNFAVTAMYALFPSLIVLLCSQ